MNEKELTFAPVRPYGARMRKPVLALLKSHGLRCDEASVVVPGTPDDEAARAIERMKVDLLVMPFHAHLDRYGQTVNGIGLLRALSPLFLQRRIPVLMPISSNSALSSFPRQFDELKRTRPDIAELVLPLPESRVDDVRYSAGLIREIRSRVAALQVNVAA
jgi:hypothetical protein